MKIRFKNLRYLYVRSYPYIFPLASSDVLIGASFYKFNFEFTSTTKYFSNVMVDDSHKKKGFHKKYDNFLTIPSNIILDPRSNTFPIKKLEEKNSPKQKNKQHAYNISTEPETERDVCVKGYMSETKKKSLDVANYFIADISNQQYSISLKSLLCVPILPINFESHTKSNENNIMTFNLSPSVFGYEPLRVDILHRCVTYQRNKKRGRRNAGATTKNISTISGSGKKVRQQKGTGMARAGHKRPPHWRGGVKAHGPRGKIQIYETKLNKKVRKLGLRIAISQKLKEGNLLVVNNFDELKSLKTNVLAQILDGYGISGRSGHSAYIVDHVKQLNTKNEKNGVYSIGGINVNLKVSSRNINNVKVVNQRSINVYDILKYKKLIISLNAVHALENRLG